LCAGGRRRRTKVHQLLHAGGLEESGANAGDRISANLLGVGGEPLAFIQAVVRHMDNHRQ